VLPRPFRDFRPFFFRCSGGGGGGAAVVVVVIAINFSAASLRMQEVVVVSPITSRVTLSLPGTTSGRLATTGDCRGGGRLLLRATGGGEGSSRLAGGRLG
jgi:hypothetical protein